MKKLSALVSALIALAVGLYFNGMDKGMGDKPTAPVVAPAPSLLEHAHLDDGDPQPGVSVGAGLLPRIAAAGASQSGCTTKLISHNFSARSAKPSMFVLHYTVSRNRAGWADVDALRNFFNNSSSQVSSHYLIDWEGHCYLLVPESQKAWTQGAFNSDSISIEFIAFGDESQSTWADKGDAGLRKGAQVVAASIKRNGIPFRYVDPVGCTPTPGITDHNDLECGNFHHDVSPNFPWAKFKGYLAAEMAPPKRCIRVRMKTGGKIVATSKKYKATEYALGLRSFEGSHRPMMVRLLKGGHAYLIGRTRVAC